MRTKPKIWIAGLTLLALGATLFVVGSGTAGANKKLNKAIMKIVGLFFQSPDNGAATSVYVATSPEVEGVTGKYFAKCRELAPAPHASDREAAERLWQVSEQLTGLAGSSASAS